MKKIAIAALSLLFIFGSATLANAQHIVKKGESLSLIAKQHQMTLKDLISLNPHISNPNLIHINDYIVIRTKNEVKKDMVDYAKSFKM